MKPKFLSIALSRTVGAIKADPFISLRLIAIATSRTIKAIKADPLKSARLSSFYLSMAAIGFGSIQLLQYGVATWAGIVCVLLPYVALPQKALFGFSDSGQRSVFISIMLYINFVCALVGAQVVCNGWSPEADWSYTAFIVLVVVSQISVSSSVIDRNEDRQF